MIHRHRRNTMKTASKVLMWTSPPHSPLHGQLSLLLVRQRTYDLHAAM
jgi:hypothetical protein